jgi:hypothetical protein
VRVPIFKALYLPVKKEDYMGFCSFEGFDVLEEGFEEEFGELITADCGVELFNVEISGVDGIEVAGTGVGSVCEVTLEVAGGLMVFEFNFVLS